MIIKVIYMIDAFLQRALLRSKINSEGSGRTWTETTASNPLRVFSAARPSSADDRGFGPEETVGCVWWRERVSVAALRGLT